MFLVSVIPIFVIPTTPHRTYKSKRGLRSEDELVFWPLGHFGGSFRGYLLRLISPIPIRNLSLEQRWRTLFKAVYCRLCMVVPAIGKFRTWTMRSISGNHKLGGSKHKCSCPLMELARKTTTEITTMEIIVFQWIWQSCKFQRWSLMDT